METIINQTKNTINKGLIKFAEKASLQPEHIQFVIFKDSEGIKYKLLHDYDEVREITFKEILNVKIDFLNQGLIANNFLLDCFKRLAREHKCEENEIELMIFTDDNIKATSSIRLYKDGEEVNKMSYNEVFGIEDDKLINQPVKP